LSVLPYGTNAINIKRTKKELPDDETKSTDRCDYFRSRPFAAGIDRLQREKIRRQG
jgi:hypothetical protein